MFGSKLNDGVYLVKVGGDLAFLSAVQKVILANGWQDTAFIEAATVGFEAYSAHLESLSMDDLVAAAGTTVEPHSLVLKDMALPHGRYRGSPVERVDPSGEKESGNVEAECSA